MGTDSKIPNVRGWRSDVVNALKAIKVPVLRWPGGCFADEYHWRDGIGPQAQRPPRVNTSWGGVIEPNSVGTHEFMDLAEQLGTEVYINANLGSGTVQEMAQWLEYLTAEGDTALARERRANGRDKPWRVQYWGIGNESWGCGGNMKPGLLRRPVQASGPRLPRRRAATGPSWWPAAARSWSCTGPRRSAPRSSR